MDRDGQLLSAVASFPKGICTCCLVERCGLTHSYVVHLCNQLRSDGKLKPLDVNVLCEYVYHRRKQQPEERCSVCGKDWPYGLVFHPIEGQDVRAVPAKDEPAFNWQEMCLAERICEELPNKDKFQCVDSAWLNAQRRIIIGLLKKIAPQRSGEKIDLRLLIEEGKRAGLLPARIASFMQMLLTFRNSATYEDDRLDLAESLMARVAADEILMWDKKRTSKGK